MASVLEMKHLTAIRDSVCEQYATIIADETNKHIDRVLDDIIDRKVNFGRSVTDNDLDGVVRLKLKADVLGRIGLATMEKYTEIKSDYRSAWSSRLSV